MTTLLIDGDLDLYRIAEITKEENEHIDDKGRKYFTWHSSAEKMHELVDLRFSEYMELLGADKIVVALTETNVERNFRRNVLPSYKENRRDTKKPLGYMHLLDYVQEKYECIGRPGLEADDILGILSTSDIIDDDTIIVSADKDMLTIPTKVYNPDHPDEGVVNVDKSTAYFNFMVQTLSGDITDNYKGCPGIGDVRARRALTTLPTEDMWGEVVRLYELADLTEADALRQSRCARILHATEYDWDKSEVKLWRPHANN